MKTIFKITLLLGVLALVGVRASTELRRFETMPISDIKKKFGNKPFSEKEFRIFDENGRASMAASLVETNPFKGKTAQDVFDRLGPSDGYYFSDKYPAYFIYRGKNSTEDAWQILFVLGKDGRIEKTVVHKNCCYREAGKIFDIIN